MEDHLRNSLQVKDSPNQVIVKFEEIQDLRTLISRGKTVLHRTFSLHL